MVGQVRCQFAFVPGGGLADCCAGAILVKRRYTSNITRDIERQNEVHDKLGRIHWVRVPPLSDEKLYITRPFYSAALIRRRTVNNLWEASAQASRGLWAPCLRVGTARTGQICADTFSHVFVITGGGCTHSCRLPFLGGRGHLAPSVRFSSSRNGRYRSS